MALLKLDLIADAFLITRSSLCKLLTKKTLRKVVSKLIEEASIYEGYITDVTVTRLTKELHYKNKSTVSRALKQLIDMEFIIPCGNKCYQLNTFLLQDPI